MTKNVLVCGASFAGLCTAWWMKQRGYDVTVVEVAAALKRGGTPVNIEGRTIDIVKRMGLFEQIRAQRIPAGAMEFKNADDVTERAFRNDGDGPDGDNLEIERDVLLDLLYGAVRDDVRFVFGDSVTAVEQSAGGVDVAFAKGLARRYDLVFGCDGIHSGIRTFCFGAEAQFSHFLKAYFSITIVPGALIAPNTTQLYNEPDKAIMLNAYNGKTDIVLCFFSENEIAYDYRDEAQQRAIIASQFADVGWRAPELLAAVKQSTTFYFDKLCQVKMPSWTTGRVALVGDAAYCASPAAGKGGSLAIDGAAALADAFNACDGDVERAFAAYNTSFRPFIASVQDDAARFGVDMLILRTEQAIRARNSADGPLDALMAR